MASFSATPGNLGLRYGSANVFDRADTRATVIAHLTPSDVFTVRGADGDFYRVELPGPVVGFVYAHNIVGTDLPLTAVGQRQADDRAALAARPTGGWRGWAQRLLRN
jgi:hypothetical protein